MSELGYLRQRICEQIQVATARGDLGRRHLGQRMREVSDAAKQFNVEAASVVQEVIVPRMQLVVELLKNAELVALDAQRPFRVQTRFRYSEELLGPGVFELSIEGRADGYDRLTIHSSLRLYPESLHASSTSASSFGFPVKHQAVAAWIDEQILKCVERIARLGQEYDDRMSDFVLDPVCEMRFPKMYAAAVEEYEGAMLYFFTERCRKEFQARPQAYL